MKLVLTLLIPVVLGLFSFHTFGQEEIDISGKWLRDDAKIRIIKHVDDGIVLTTAEQDYFYKRIGLNQYQMNWTPSEYGGEYRWTMTVLNEKEFSNFFEKSTGTYTVTRSYIFQAVDTTDPSFNTFE